MPHSCTLERVEAAPLALRIEWRDGQLVRLNVCRANGEQTPTPSAGALAFKAALEDYVAGRKPRWPEPELDWSGVSPFARKALEALKRHATHGKTLTYGELAGLAGSPGAARAVGGAMAKNPFPLLYPCHRVLGAKGALTGFSAEGGTETKALLLGIERGEPAC
ncbi:MAG: methylated-DNA--[protein]-cysteine S-methyltransferase [Desulfovibrionaceae bacterium]